MKTKFFIVLFIIFLSGICFAVQIGGPGNENREFFKNQEIMHNEDRNDITRHGVTNLNNGINAASAYTAYNDTKNIENYRISFGIWSSNATTIGGPGPNGGGIGIVSDGVLEFTHYYDQPTIWKNNPSDDGNLANTVERMRLTEDQLWIDTICDLSGSNCKDMDIDNGNGELGEVRLFALSITNSITKTSLQDKGWAICDGTTPETQGISDSIITTTPNLEEKFIRMSNDETSGKTGGESEHTLTIDEIPEHTHNIDSSRAAGVSNATRNGDGVTGSITTQSTGGSLAHNNLPPYYDLVYFIKVK